jgi:hypothetical protein
MQNSVVGEERVLLHSTHARAATVMLVEVENLLR